MLNTHGKFVNPAEIIHLLGLKEGSKFADFGSGSGAFVLAAAPLVGNTGTIAAIDVQKDLLLKLKQLVIESGNTNVRFLWCDFEIPGATKLPNDSLDTVLISNTLFQLHDKNGAITEAYRVLKKGGELYIIDWTESFNGMGPDKNLIITKDEASELAESIGLTLVNTFEPGAHHYGIKLTK